MTTKQCKLIDQIRQAATKCGTSQNTLAIAAGMHRVTLNRFISGKRGLSM
jgi:plasmid maintenance system antidote protein VapI